MRVAVCAAVDAEWVANGDARESAD